MATNRRTIIRIQQRGGDKSAHATIEDHARAIIADMFSVRMANTLRITIKIRSTVLADGTHGDCDWRDESKGATAKSKHHTIRLQGGRGLAETLRTLTHELKHVEQMVTGRLQFRVTYGVPGFFWRVPGYRGAALKFQVDCDYRSRPWEVEARHAEIKYHG